MTNKRGQMTFAGAEGFITMFLVAIIMVIVAATIIGNVQTSSLPTESINITNFQFTPQLNNPVSLGTGRVANFAAWNSTNITNTIGTGNYTFDGAAGIVTFTSAQFAGSAVNSSFNYTRATQGASFNSTDNAAKGLAGTTSLFPVLGVVAVASLVIGLIIAGLGMAARRP